MLSQEVRKFIKEKLALVSDSSIIEETSLTEGRSGADVYRIKVCSRKGRLTGSYIVKVCNISDKEKESDKAKILYQNVPSFSEHLVKVEAEKEIEGKNVIIYAQANNSVRDMVAFSQLDGEHIARYMSQVSYDILALMNEEEQTRGEVTDFFNCLLTKQLSPNGRFEDRVGNLLNNPEAECIALNGEIYPNPLHCIKHMFEWEDCLSNQVFFKGIVHGDLHGGNLIASEKTYSIIDYDGLMFDSYLFFDHAYFEFSIFYDNSKDNDIKKWSAMLKNLVGTSFLNEAIPCENYREYMVRNAVCEGIRKWMFEKKLEKMKNDIELQFMMARIASGINFICKRSCTDTGKQIKVLFYIAYCFKLLLDKIGYQYDVNDVSGLSIMSEYNDTETLWEHIVKFTNYVPVLVTDNRYRIEDVAQMESLCAIDWQMVVDIGLEQSDSLVYKIFLDNCQTRVVKKINIVAKEKTETFKRTLNVLSLRKPADSSYQGLWRNYGNDVMNAIKKMISANSRVPLVFIFDCSKDSLAFKNQLVNELCNLKLPESTRIISLRALFSNELREEIVELENTHKWRFEEFAGANLNHIAQTCKVYLNRAGYVGHSVNLPSINDICIFSEKDIINFESSIELVYSGCEYISKNRSECGGLDLVEGDSLGESFYKGSEATWNDIANHRDLDLLEKGEYDRIQDRLSRLLEEKSPRVKTTVLLHGAGAGGTTLSKRILWDFKEQVPCACLKKYSSQTAHILLEIYQRTGKCILLSVEAGSTVISDDELIRLKKSVDAENGRMVILLVKRSENDNYAEQEGERAAVLKYLGDTLPVRIAKKFNVVFSEYAMKRENGIERCNLLEQITGNDSSKEQRSPFFYGFYAFQEEYQLLGSLSRTVSACSSAEQTLLNNLALVTCFSQNVCVAFSELSLLLEWQSNDAIGSVYSLFEKLPSALFKLMTIRDKGLRLCHKVIAEKILLILHDPEGKYDGVENVVFQATKEYIQSMSKMYDNDSEYVNDIMKELIIDRAYIDSEERKTKFSLLVESIPHWTDRKALFDYLIDEFPNNAHYYNHLARLLATGDKKSGISPRYEEAEGVAEMAIEIAANAKSIHETTLGCIYGQWILKDIDEEKKNKKNGRLSSKLDELISNINVRYCLGKEQFENARENVDIYDSFSYFPQINMECEIIKHLIAFDSERNLGRLLEEEPTFREWYDEHYSIATELYLMMDKQLGENAQFIGEAKSKIEEITLNSNEKINKQFNKLLDSDSPTDRRRRRTLVYTVFTINGCNWNHMEQETIHLAEKCFRKNILERDENHVDSDIETWLELYRRSEYFQASEAQSLIADYMEDGYRKNYLLFLMTFIMRKEGIASASIESIIRRIGDVNRIARLNGLNTAREHDVYVGSNNGRCPILSLSAVDRDEKKGLEGLETFTGIVTEVEQTHGKILLDKLNLDVTFVPKPLSVGEDTARIFTREDINSPVKLNIMFSYSGLRGWDVMKI